MMRTVLCEDALAWLTSAPTLEGHSFVASLPDISEFPGHTLEQWQNWFTDTAGLILSRCHDAGVTVFYQTDIKLEGTWVDKAYLCQKAAEATGHHLLWHKILCRAPAGMATYGRPSYSHLLCFSKAVKLPASSSTADVIEDLGEKTWQRGMGLLACLLIAKFLKEQTSTHTVVNPFCGQGSMLAAANFAGFDALGIERSPKRATIARELQVAENGKSWKHPRDF
jgi:hypothetical protein